MADIVATGTLVVQLGKTAYEELKKRATSKAERKTVVRHFGLILQELYQNLETLACAADQHKWTPPFVFGVWDACFADLIRQMPVPRVIPDLQLVVADLKLLAQTHGENTKRAAPLYNVFSKNTDYWRRYDLAREILIGLGREVFGNDWQQEEPLLVPPDSSNLEIARKS